MSVLETPRIYFQGEVSWDPIVTNNYCSNYDEELGATVFPGAADVVKAFRNNAITAVPGGNWNPHGTHRSIFYNTAVKGFDAGAGLQTRDPFVSATVNLRGMLVDLEPFGAYTSQLFFDSMLFGVEGGYRIQLPRRTRFTARYINFGRNSANRIIAGIASVVWQTSFAKADGLRIDAFDSPALQKLAAALAADDVLGLTVQFNAYRTIYYDNPNLRNRSPETAKEANALVAKLQAGGFQPNPARSLLVGVLGLWRNQEPIHEPGDRTLIPTPNSQLASIHARTTKTSLTLDLSNSVPEVDDHLTKLNLGTLTVGTVDAAGANFHPLATLDYSQYDKAAYEATAGIVTLPLPPATSAAGLDLQVRDASNNVLLQEVSRRAIPVTPNLYLDQGESATAQFQVYERGVILKKKVDLSLYEVNSTGGTPLQSTAVQTSSTGLLTVPLHSDVARILALVPSFSDLDSPNPGGINTQSCTYAYIRVRPADPLIAALPATWDNVYAQVLANWNAMAPCMDNWLKLDDPAQIKAYAAILKRLTDPNHLESYMFMPVTRDLSPGQRALLYKFLDTAEEAAPAPRSTLDQLSRSMRRA